MLIDLHHLLQDQNDVDVSPLCGFCPYDVDVEITSVFSSARIFSSFLASFAHIIWIEPRVGSLVQSPYIG